MPSMTRDSINAQAMRSLLATVQADFTKRAATEHVRARLGSLRDVLLPVKEATKFVDGELAKHNATRREEPVQECKTMCVITMITDASLIALESSAAFNKDAPRCALLSLVTWWVLGLLTMRIDQKLPLSDAIHVLSQQVTSIGYGTATNSNTGIKLFHGLHGVLSQMSVARVTSEAIGKILQAPLGSSPSGLAGTLAIAIAASTFWFMNDLHTNVPTEYPAYWDPLWDALYQCLITMTTIGYGDLSPQGEVSKFLTPVGLPMLTNAFANFVEATKPGALEEAEAEGEAPEKAEEAPEEEAGKSEICECFGSSMC